MINIEELAEYLLERDEYLALNLCQAEKLAEYVKDYLEKEKK